MTRNTIEADLNRRNAQNTFNELLAMEVIPVVNENDTISTFEVEDVIGDNDTLSAIVTALTGADLLILLSDIDGLYTGISGRTNYEIAEIIKNDIKKIQDRDLFQGFYFDTSLFNTIGKYIDYWKIFEKSK